MKTIKNILRKTNVKVRQQRILKEIKSSNNENVQKFYKVIKLFLKDGPWSIEDKKAFKIVNDIRESLLLRDETILVKDYGAIDANSILTMKQLEKGVEIERKISDICLTATTPENWGKLLYTIIRTFKPSVCLELGTNLGISASYQIQALKYNNYGKIITLEGAKNIAEIAKQILAQHLYTEYRIEIGKFSDILPSILQKEKIIDLVFIDGHHDKNATKKYFEMIYPYLAQNSIIIFDDINWSKGMQEVWNEISQDKRISFSIDLNKWGICFFNDKSNLNIGNRYSILLNQYKK